jgi:hypothetical protein
MESTRTLVATRGEVSLNRESASFRRSPKPAISNTPPYIPYRRARKSSHSITAQQDEFACLSSEEDEDDDNEVCNFGDSFGALKSSLPGAKWTKDACLDLLECEHAAAEQATEAAMGQQLTREYSADESALELALTRESSLRDNDLMMSSPPPLPKRSLSDLEVMSSGYTRVIGDQVHSDAVLAAKRARCGDLEAKLRHLGSQLDAADDTSANDFSPNSPQSKFHDAPRASFVHANMEAQALTTPAMLSLPTLSAHRLRAQGDAVEYRRSVRKQLQSAALAARSSGLSVGLFGGAGKVGGLAWDLYATPCDVLDYEVLSGDEEEDEVCRERRAKWTVQTRALYHEL